MQAKERLIVSLDVDNLDQAKKLLDALSPEVEIFKVGIVPFINFGDRLINEINSRGNKVFLDLKFYDIPNTIKNAVRIAKGKGVYMMNFHCLGGKKMLEAAVKEAKRAQGKNTNPPILLGVTILTSMKEEDMHFVGIGGRIEERVIKLALIAAKAGMDGVVASAKEARSIKRQIGKDFIVVAPGVRPVWAKRDDQKRVVTPRQAIANGADYIVVGRPIIQAKNPIQAAKRIVEEIK